MSSNPERPQGLCDAFACPLFGSVGRAGAWVCLCHANADSAVWQEITRLVRENEAIAASTLDIRRFQHSEDWPSVYRAIVRRLREAGRDDLLPTAEKDGSPYRTERPIVGQWLMRLELELVRICEAVKPKHTPSYGIPATVPTAPVPTPARAIEHVPRYYRDNEHEGGR
jgi:hypothetical protein